MFNKQAGVFPFIIMIETVLLLLLIKLGFSNKKSTTCSLDIIKAWAAMRLCRYDNLEQKYPASQY